jgi:hypothetical protein
VKTWLAIVVLGLGVAGVAIRRWVRRRSLLTPGWVNEQVYSKSGDDRLWK